MDFAGGYVAAIGLLAGVWRARRDNIGCDVDVSLFETGLALLTYMATWNASRGWVAQRMPDSSHQTIVPFQTFPASDGFLVVACAKDSLWGKLCEALGRPELAEDERFADMAARNRNREDLVALLKHEFAQRSVTQWIDRLTVAGVPCGPVNDIETALADEQAQARDSVVEYEHPTLGVVRTVASPFGAQLRRDPVRGPLLGEDDLGEIG